MFGITNALNIVILYPPFPAYPMLGWAGFFQRSVCYPKKDASAFTILPSSIRKIWRTCHVLQWTTRSM